MSHPHSREATWYRAPAPSELPLPHNAPLQHPAKGGAVAVAAKKGVLGERRVLGELSGNQAPSRQQPLHNLQEKKHGKVSSSIFHFIMLGAFRL